MNLHADQCRHCGAELFHFDKAPDFAPEGWATDESGDLIEDFICPERESSSRYPIGKPHERIAS